MVSPKNEEDAENGTNAIVEFISAFGDTKDIYNQIIIEELLKILMGVKENEE
jgi:hypothetical protein